MITIPSLIFAGTIYYVDATYGNDLNDGLSPSLAWQTISKVNRGTFTPGDIILFKRGEVWREQLVPSSSGVIGSPITFGAYGTGRKPKIFGSITKNKTEDWMLESDNIWISSGTIDLDVGNLIMDSEKSIGVKCDNRTDLDNQGDFWYDSTIERVYLFSASNPATYYKGNIECAQKRHIVSIWDKNYITIRDLDLRYGGAHGIWCMNVDNIIVRCCDFSYIGGSFQTGTVRYGNGVEFWNSASNTTVEICRFWEIYDAAVTTQGLGANNSKFNQHFRYNLIWNCEYSFEFWNHPDTSFVEGIYFQNNTCLNAGGGWGHHQRDDPQGRHLCFYSNTARTNDFYVQNNIFYESTDNAIRLSSSWRDLDNLILDYNCYYQSSGDMIVWQDSSYTMDQFKAYQADKAQDAHSIAADPLFIDLLGNNIALQSTSSCIDAGIDLGLTEDYAGNTVPYGWAVDIGAYEYVGSPDPLDAEINSSPTSGWIPLTVNFSGSATGGTEPYNFYWDFGDGESSSEQNPSHTYSSAGDYTVKLTINDSTGNEDTNSIIIYALANPSEADLLLFTATGDPAPDQGGTTDPQPGNHSYALGRSVQIEAIPNPNYRFSKWNGDVTDSDAGKNQISITMNTDKSISALFCIKCGDVTGDLNVTPLDAQKVFEIFLLKFAKPSECQKENADVNSDGSMAEPSITPGDAQAIFNKYLGISELPSDCSINARSADISTQIIHILDSQEDSYQEINLIIDDVNGTISEIIAIPVIIDNPQGLDSFGFDLTFPSENLRFIGVEKTELVTDFHQIDGYEVQEGILRVGGYSSEPILSDSPGVLVRLLFRATNKTEQSTPLFFTNAFDDLKNAIFNTGIITINESDYKRTKRKKIIR